MSDSLEQAINVTGVNALDGAGYRFSLVSLTSLFFIWGFITALNDILIPYLKAMFELNYTQAMLIQFCFFGAYFIVSIPAGALVSRIGYQRGIISGLMISSIGCFMFYPAATEKIYALFLLALFVLASGITILQVSANPFVSALGEPHTASARLTLTQAFNSLGTAIAPFFGAWLILSNVSEGAGVKIPYILLASVLLIMALIFSLIKLPKLGHANNSKAQRVKGNALRHSQLSLGAIAIFVYVGAEVGIGSFLVSFITQQSISNYNEARQLNT